MAVPRFRPGDRVTLSPHGAQACQALLYALWSSRYFRPGGGGASGDELPEGEIVTTDYFDGKGTMALVQWDRRIRSGPAWFAVEHLYPLD